MSSIDNRVVVLTFDNKDFERNVQTSMGTIDKLKNALKFQGASDGLKSITAATKSFDLSPLAEGIEKIKSRFSGLGIAGMAVIQNMTNSAIGFVKNAVGNVIDPIVEGGMKRAQNLEQAHFMLQGLLGKDAEGAKKIDDIMGAVQRSVKGTAYGLGDAARVASQLVASGIEDADRMESILRGIAGTAAMTGSNFDEIGHIFTTVSSNGKLMTEQIRQFSYRGLNVTAQLAKELNVTEEEIHEMVKAGAIDFETFATAMDSAFGEHAKDANQTYAGSLSNVQAALSRIGESFQTPKLERMKNLFNALIPLIDTIHERLKPFIEIINGALDRGTEKTIKFVERLTEMLGGTTKKVAEEVNGTAEAVEDAAERIGHSAEEIDEMARRVQSGEFGNGEDVRRKALEELGYSFEEVQNRVNELEGSTYRYEVAQQELITTTEEVGNASEDTAESVESMNKQFASSAFLNFVTGVKNVVQGVKDFVGAFKNGVLNAFTGQGTTFLKSVNRISAAFREFTDNLVLSTSEKGGLERIFTGIFIVIRSIALVGLKIVEVILTVLKWGAQLRRKVLDFIGNLQLFNKEVDKTSRASRFFEALRGVFKKISVTIDSFAMKLVDVGKKIKQTEGYKKLTEALTKLHDAVKKVFDKLKEFAGKVLDKIIGKMENFSKGKTLKFDWLDVLVTVFDKITGALGAFIDECVDGFPRVREFFAGIKEWATGKFGSLVDLFGSAKDKIKGFIEAFKGDGDGNGKLSVFLEILGKIKEHLKEMFNLGGANTSVLEPVKNFFGFLRDLAGGKFESASEVIGSLKDSIVGFFQGISAGGISEWFNNIKEGAGGKLGSFLEFLGGIKDKLKEIFKLDGESVSAIDIIKGFFNFLKETASDKAGTILDFLSKIKEGIAEFIGGLGESGTGGIQVSIIGSIQKVFTDALNGVGEFFAGIETSGFVEGVKSFISKVSEIFDDVDTEKVLEFIGKVGEVLAKLIMFRSLLKTLSGARTLMEQAGGSFQSLSSMFQQIGGMFSSIGGFFTNLQSTIQNAIKSKQTTEKMKLLIIGIGVVVASIFVLSKIPEEDLIRACETLAGVMAALVGVFAIMASIPMGSGMVKDFGVAMLGLGVGVLAISLAAKLLGAMDLKQLVQGGIAIGVFVIAMGAAARIAGSVKAAAAFMGLALAIDLLVPAIAILGLLPWPVLEKAAISIGVICLELALAAGAVGKMGGGKGAAAFLGMAAAIDILVPALLLIGLLPVKVIAKGVAGIAGILLAMAGAIRLASSPVSTKGGTNMLKMTVPLIAAIVGLKVLADVPMQAMITNAAVLSGMMLVLAGALKWAKGGGTGANNMLKMTVPLAVAIAGLAVLANMPMDGMIAGAACVAGLMLTLVAAFKLCKGGSKGADNMVKMTLPLGVAIAGLAVLANMPITGMIAGAACLAGVLAVLVGLTYVAKGAKDGAMMMLMLTAPLAAAIAGLYILAQQPWENLLAAAVALGGVFLAVSLAIAILSKVDFLGGLSAIGLLDLFFISITAIVAVIGALFGEGGRFAGVMEKAIPVMEDLGSAIGGFISSLITTIGEGVAETIERFGEAIGNFGDSIVPFIEAAKTVDADVVDGIGRLVAGLLLITAGELLDGIHQFITGESSLESFGKELVAFSVYLVDYANRVSGISEDSLTGSTRAAEMIANFYATTLPTHGGLKGLWEGNPLIHFGEELAGFGPNLLAYSQNVTQINEEAVAGSARAGTILAAMYKDVTNAGINGGIIGLLEGNPLKHFGYELSLFGPYLAAYSESINGVIDEASVTASSNAGQALAVMYKAVTDSGIDGGIIGVLEGNPLKHFGYELSLFGPYIAEYAKSVGGAIDETDVKASASAGTMLAEMYAAVTSAGISGGWEGLWEGKPLQKFGKELEAFGPLLVAYGDSLTGLKTSQIQEVNGVIPALVDMAASANSASYDQITDYGEALKDFGEKLKDYYDSIKDVSTSKISAVIKTTYDLINVGGAMADVETSAMGDFGNALKNIGDTGVDEFVSALENSTSTVANAVMGMIHEAASGGSDTTSFYYIGINMGQGMINGLADSSYAVMQTAANIANAAVNTIRSCLQIFSPSRVMEHLGEFAGLGLANGLRNKTIDVERRSEQMADTIIETAAKPIEQLQNAINSGIDFEPVVTPVLDLTNLNEGAASIGSLLGPTEVPLTLGGIGATALNTILGLADRIGESRDSQQSVVDAIGDLRSDVVTLGERMSRLQVMLDGQTLVGGIIDPLDEALGQRAILSERGV